MSSTPVGGREVGVFKLTEIGIDKFITIKDCY